MVNNNTLERQDVIDLNDISLAKPKKSFVQADDPIEVDSDQNKVLIVDDEDMNVFCLRAQLSDLQVSSDSTIKSTRALELVKSRICKVLKGEASMYKLCLIDYCMPELDGLALVKEARRLCTVNKLS